MTERELAKLMKTRTTALFEAHRPCEIVRMTKMAKASVGGWSREGRISVLGALALEKAGLHKARYYRPDVQDWETAKKHAINRSKSIRASLATTKKPVAKKAKRKAA